ncbi:MAG TPA: hypothetical protein VL346_02225 [Acidobacteriaceae bacterium]|nr:hypothetical protein [Acidobacteriaceae bacterium]
MHLLSASQMAMLRFHGFRRGGHDGLELALLLLGVVFAGLLVWVIERSGRPRIYR